MSKLRMFIGFWIALIVFGIIFPGAFYLLSKWLDNLLGFSPFPPESVSKFLAALALLIGIFWVLWAYSYLHFVGRGSPIEAFGIALYPTQTLVTSGPYAYTRNPMVLGELFILLGIAFAVRSLSGLLLIPVLAVAAVIYLKMFEEPALVRRFGEAYLEYRRRVPVLIPKFR
ncbi:MAG: isoprenylcysteine carboxylmethyltransferase family protein [Armatimonadota bacterium]|nr:isoprenylcysteine carboxylmethyltransferase family protein [Armatimonadota bacterium]